MTTKQVVELINTMGVRAFYLCHEWRAKRAKILREQHFECQECKKNGKVVRATTVHHIKRLKEFPELALEDSNLEAVCSNCHNVLHPEKLKNNYKSKRKEWNDERW